MGTSSSSRGPGPNVPFVPPWVPQLPPPMPPPPDPNDGSPPDADDPDNKPLQTPPPDPPAIAPAARFRAARTSLGHFARTGSGDDLKRGLGHYTKTGLGGAAQATRRMAVTAVTAGRLHATLSALSSSTGLPAGVVIDPGSLAGRPAREVIDRIARALQPPDGTQDGEASRDAIARSLSELMEAQPDADFNALTLNQIEFVTQTYVGEDLCLRIDLDIGKTVLDKASSIADGQTRLEEMKAYIRQEVAHLFRVRRDRGQRMTTQNAASMAAGVIQSVFHIFEEYLR